MQLLVAGRGIGSDHLARLGHRRIRRQVLPRVRAEMVAAQDHLRAVEPDRVRDAPDQVAEVGRPHAGIAAILVDLVAGRLDQGRAAIRHRLSQRRLDHQRMRRAHRGDADGLAGLTPASQRQQGLRAHPDRLEDKTGLRPSIRVTARSRKASAFENQFVEANGFSRLRLERVQGRALAFMTPPASAPRAAQSRPPPPSARARRPRARRQRRRSAGSPPAHGLATGR